MLKVIIFFCCVCANYVAAEDIAGRIESVDSNGVVQLTNDVNLLVWGLDEVGVAELADFLTGRWIICQRLESKDNIILADCEIARNGAIPSTRADLLHMATWLPQFKASSPSCGVGGFSQEFRIKSELYGEIQFGCANGVPFRGILGSPSSLY